ncbi:uncharacterized protein LOC142870909 [Microcebus murinus]|uniref:uncharacterized protein LOC142870909 n=1 Tax=Microcebus murinus TaxID=30608 RepID=UPI003F6C6D9D
MYKLKNVRKVNQNLYTLGNHQIKAPPGSPMSHLAIFFFLREDFRHSGKAVPVGPEARALASPGVPRIPGAGRGGPAGRTQGPRGAPAPGPRRGGAEPAPASPAGWSRKPEISARTASLSSPQQPGTAGQESTATPPSAPLRDVPLARGRKAGGGARGGVVTPGSRAQFSARGKMAPLLTRRRDHTHASPSQPPRRGREGRGGRSRRGASRSAPPAGAAGASAGPANRLPARQS